MLTVLLLMGRVTLAIPLAVLAVWLGGAGLRAQVLLDVARMPQAARLFDDFAREGGRDSGRALSCRFESVKPAMNFGFRTQAGYHVTMPVRSFAGNGHAFVALTRVTPQGGAPVYLAQAVKLPALPEKSKDDLELGGLFFLGEGRYDVEWLLRDDRERACFERFRLEVKPPDPDQIPNALLPPGAVVPVSGDWWTRAFQKPANVDAPRLTILLHAAPMYWRSQKLRASDRGMLLSAVVSFLEQTDFSSVRLVAFNLDQQRELFRTDRLDQAGFSELVRALEELSFGTVPFSVVERGRAGHQELLAGLLAEQASLPEPSDAVVLLSPTVRHGERPAAELLAKTTSPRPPLFYLEFKPLWVRGGEFPDLLEHVTRRLEGKVVKIRSPRDLAVAIQRVEGRVQPRQGDSE